MIRGKKPAAKAKRPALKRNVDRTVSATTPLDRVAIVEKHCDALIDELREHGHFAVGVAGCIVFAAEPDDVTSPGHVFHLIAGDCVANGGGPPDRDLFMMDVVETMRASVLAGRTIV